MASFLEIGVIILISAVAFVVMLSLIVFIHEYGHFSVARACGVKVDAFSIGFGKALASWTDKHGTVWKVCLLPLGGYVKFFGDAGPASDPDKDVVGEAEEGPRAPTTQFPGNSEKERLSQRLSEEEQKVCFHFKPLWQKAAIVAAGPAANFILAMVIFTMLFWIYGDSERGTEISGFSENSAAQAAGFEVGDEILSINGKATPTFQKLGNIISLNNGETLVMEVKRGEDILTLTVVPEMRDSLDGLGNKIQRGMIGIVNRGEPKLIEFGFLGAVKHSAVQIRDMLSMTVKFIVRLVQGKEDPKQLSGPLYIGKYAGQAAMIGFDERVPEETPFSDRLIMSLVTFISIAGSISVSIGFLNLLPIPVLDGGHLLFYGVEAVTRRPVPEVVQMVGLKIGLVLLASLMIFVFYNDFTKLLVNSG